MLFGTPKTTITLAKKGNQNLSKKSNQLIIKKRVFFEKIENNENLLDLITKLDNDPSTHKHSPRFIIVTDFKRFVAIDTKTKENLDEPILNLWKRVDFFLPWSGKEKYQAPQENHADIKAAEKMAKIYDEIYHNNVEFYHERNHDLNVFLTRLLFCFFAEDTGIFAGNNLFTEILSNHTSEDGSDLKDFFALLFKALDSKNKDSLPAYIQDMPYVNGSLFSQEIEVPDLSVKARALIIECGDLNWKNINPDIFGSMFQAVKVAEVRSGLGQHYTSVPNIMKVINPLFMDELREEFNKSLDSEARLKKLQLRIAKIKIFDPACGSGNFLIIAFKQLKLLEMDIIKRINDLKGWDNFQMNLSQIELKNFYGIEIDDFACEIAKLSLWLAEHQMNCKFKDEIGEPKPTLPLCESGKIVHGNACRLNWEDVCPKYICKTGFDMVFARSKLQNTPLKLDLPKEEAEVYILGNPPYIGSKLQTKEQKQDIEFVFSRISSSKNIDYIVAWFFLGKKYITNSASKLAFVSTNSITQGEQVPSIWKNIIENGVEIFFAHASFKWANNAKYKAGVTCVIIGLSINPKIKFMYRENIKVNVTNINPYLIDYRNTYIESVTKPISSLFPEMKLGSTALDGDFLKLNQQDKDLILKDDDSFEKFIKPFLGGQSYIENKTRYCIWVKNEEEFKEAKKNKELNKRFLECQRWRLSKGRDAKSSANTPYKFKYDKYKEDDALIIPATTSENRAYIPIGFINKNFVVDNGVCVVYKPSLLLFGVVTSRMHMTWVRAVAGRLKTDYRYSATLVYNTFPFPDINDKQKAKIELYVNYILKARENHSEKTMAELYDPDKMPKDLLEAHQSLDLVIEQCYRSKPFENDEERLKHLFKMYEMMTNNATEEELKQLELGV